VRQACGVAVGVVVGEGGVGVDVNVAVGKGALVGVRTGFSGGEQAQSAGRSGMRRMSWLRNFIMSGNLRIILSSLGA